MSIIYVVVMTAVILALLIFFGLRSDSASDEIEGVVNGPRWLDAPSPPPAGLIPQHETPRPAQLPANGNQAQTLIEGAT